MPDVEALLAMAASVERAIAPTDDLPAMAPKDIKMRVAVDVDEGRCLGRGGGGASAARNLLFRVGGGETIPQGKRLFKHQF